MAAQRGLSPARLHHFGMFGLDPLEALLRALRAGGRVVVVDLDRETNRHGIPPGLLFCEFAAVGFRLGQFVRKPELQGYYAEFELTGDRPAPASIKPCGQAATVAEKAPG